MRAEYYNSYGKLRKKGKKLCLSGLTWKFVIVSSYVFENVLKTLIGKKLEATFLLSVPLSI